MRVTQHLYRTLSALVFDRQLSFRNETLGRPASSDFSRLSGVSLSTQAID